MDEAQGEILRELVDGAIADASESRLLARGMARAVIRRDGIVPEGGPRFGTLTPDLLDFAFGILAVALEMRKQPESKDLTDVAFRDAGEALDAVVRNGAAHAENDFYRVIAAAAFHLGGYAARSYSTLPANLPDANLSVAERTLSLLMRRQLLDLRAMSIRYLNSTASRAKINAAASNPDIDPEAFLREVITSHFVRAMMLFSRALMNGDERLVSDAVEMLVIELRIAEQAGFVPLWWIIRLAQELIDELWSESLHRTVPPVLPGRGGADPRWSTLRSQYISNLVAKGHSEVELWPSQLAAVSRIFDDNQNVVVALPTGAGKTRIAELAILKALAYERRVFYVTPLRALSAQVERDLRRVFGSMEASISSLYSSIGAQELDLVSLRSANIVVLTPEKLHFAIRMEPDILDDVGLIVLDEGHMIGLNLREIRYETLVQRLLQRADADTRRIVCLSAVLPNGEELKDFAAWIGRNGERCAIDVTWRPTQLRFGDVDWRGDGGWLTFYDASEAEGYFAPRFITPQQIKTPAGLAMRPFPRRNNELTLAVAAQYVNDNELVLIYSPQQNWVESIAEAAVASVRDGGVVFPIPPKRMLERAIRIAREWLGPEHVVIRALQVGVGMHHGDLPMPLREELESLFKAGHLRVLISSPTLAQGLNITVSVVLFQSIYRSGSPIELGEFINVCGRAGRPYAASEGHVLYCAYPETSVPKKNKALRAWKNRVAEVANRHVRSGIYELVGGLLRAMSARNIESFENLSEYILNLRVRGAKDDIRLAEGLSLYADTLDETILSLIGGSSLEASDLADALDEVLRGSLWERELSREESAIQDRYKHFLSERARYVWRRTSEEQRTRFFWAGLSVESGLALDAVLTQLSEAYSNAEAAIEERNLPALLESAITLARTLFSVPGFSGDEPPPNGWEEVLRKWLSGSVLTQGASIDPKVLSFVQGSQMFSLVWGIEAVRAFAGAQAGLDVENIPPSRLSAIIEVGVPNMESVYLIRSGLDSRLAAATITGLYDVPFNSAPEMLAWLMVHPAQQFERIAWPSEDARESWFAFLKTIKSTQRDFTEELLSVAWEHELSTGIIVDAIPATEHGRFDLFADDPEVPMGHLVTQSRPHRPFRGLVFGDSLLPM